jgi:outer membrane protein insertion porin family
MVILRVMIGLMLTALVAAAETRVRIEGMRHASEGEVLDLIGGRLTHVRASRASAPLADDAAFILRRILRKDGYTDAAVEWRISSRDEIVLVVDEGGRLSLGDVKVNGVAAEDAKKLARLYAKPAEKGRPLAAGSPPFREQDVETGLAFVRQEFNARGYWLAEAVIVTRATHAATGAVDLTIDVRPGALHQIARPTVTSAEGVGEELTRTTVEPFVGRAATTGHLNAMRLAVEEAAVTRGYPDAKIRMSQTLESGRFIPGFSIEFGKRVRLNQIRTEGLERTHPARIAARMKDMEGDWYDEAAMSKRLREFLATGAFFSARVETSEAGDQHVDATLHFVEARAREVSLAAGFGSYQGFITRVTYSDRNLFGNLMGFSSGFELSMRGLLGDVRITDPWFMGSDVSASARAYALMYGREGYDTDETGLEAKFSWKFGKHYTLDLLAGYSIVNLSEDGLPDSELGATLYTHPRIRLTQILDFRDNPVLPRKGWHLESPLEIGAAVGDVSTSYVKAGLTGGWFHEINRRYQVGIGGEWGVIIPSGDGGNLPIDLRLFNGGTRSVRSFPERELGPSVNGFPTGGEAMWNTNLELVRTLSGAVKAVAFFDAGALSRNHEEISGSEIELAAGLGIRFDLPIGPVRLEYGHNLTRDPGEPNGTIHFAIGFAY